MKDVLVKLDKRLDFLDDTERKKVIHKYKKKIEEELKDGVKLKEVLKQLGGIDGIIKTICEDYNLNYEYCVRQSSLDKDVNNIAKIISTFIRDIIKIVRKTTLGLSLEAFLETLVKIIIVIFLVVMLKLPFILLGSLGDIINRFIFYPFNDSFDIAVNFCLSLLYLILCVIIMLKVFGTYKIREKKEVSKKQIEIVDKEYNWLEFVIRLCIYLIVLIPLILLSLIALGGIAIASYLVSRGVDLIGIPILIVGLLGLLCSLIGAISDSLRHKSRSYLLPIILSIIIFVGGILVSINNFSKFKYPLTLDKSSVQVIEEEKFFDIEEETSINVKYGTKEVLLDNNLVDNQIKVVIRYCDDYIDVLYSQDEVMGNNYLTFTTKIDDNINYSKTVDYVIKDLKSGYMFNYSNTKKIDIKIYANSHTKALIKE